MLVKLKNIGKHPIYLPQVDVPHGAGFAPLPQFLRENDLGPGSTVELDSNLVELMCETFPVFSKMCERGHDIFVWDPNNAQDSEKAANLQPARDDRPTFVALPPGYELVTMPDGSKAYAPILLASPVQVPTDGTPAPALVPASPPKTPAVASDFTAPPAGSAKPAK